MEDQVIYESVSGLRRMDKRRVACPYCKGVGTITRRKFYGHTDGWVNESYGCGVCKGQRVLDRVITIEYIAV